MEPKNKKSFEWKEWFVRHSFGGTFVEGIRMADTKALVILMDFLRQIQQKKQGQKK